MANQTDLERVRSAIEALHAGNILYSEFDAIVATVIAAGSMTREDVRHELEAALMADNIRRDPTARSSAEMRVPPEVEHRVGPASSRPSRSERQSRAWVGRLLVGIAALVLLGAFVGFMIPRLQFGKDNRAPELSPPVEQAPSPDLVPSTADASPPLQPTPPLPTPPSPPTPTPPSAPSADVPLSPPAAASPPPVDHPAAPQVSTPTVMRQEDPDFPPPNAENTPHLRVAQGHETFADLCPYPRTALAHGETGKVGLLAYVGTDGHVLNTEVISSSGSADLDAAASTCIKDNGNYVPKFAAGRALGYWGRTTFNWSFGE